MRHLAIYLSKGIRKQIMNMHELTLLYSVTSPNGTYYNRHDRESSQMRDLGELLLRI